MMQTVAWWPTLIILAVATVVDIRSRRIPNWLSLPFLLIGVVGSAIRGGLPALGQSVAGITVAIALAGILCYLRGMGMGDLKLCAAVGAWIGPGQLLFALIVTGIAGGIMAVIYAVWHGSLGRSFDSTAELVSGFRKRGLRPHPVIAMENRQSLKMPYAPAIAVGTIFSFFAR
jgi:prepilin peptidase CpaA